MTDGSGHWAGHDLVVVSRSCATPQVVVFELASSDGTRLPGWEPGAHIDLMLGPGLVRQYSLCGDPADSWRWRIAVQLEDAGRGGSRLVHDKLTVGASVLARGPRNAFPLRPAARYQFIAGGIGITPIVPMLAAAQASGSPWQLVYGGRTRSSMAFAAELTARYPGRVTLVPQDEGGLLDLDALLGQPGAGTHVYCCGPAPLIAAVESRCAAWPAGTLHVERFVPRELEPCSGPASFEVMLARSGLTLVVPREASILTTIEAAGVFVLSSCTEGTCGTCETTVLAGIPEHLDSVLTDAEQASCDVMMICVSRSLTPGLVLDL
ncbi:MAG TPA: PDR/VanB family oxidoreductase [Streptosporangiaceae bacterium]